MIPGFLFSKKTLKFCTGCKLNKHIVIYDRLVLYNIFNVFASFTCRYYIHMSSIVPGQKVDMLHGFNGSKLLPNPACNKVVEGVDPQTKPGGRVTRLRLNSKLMMIQKCGELPLKLI